ncbi:unnamed protein product [Prorocentrum cordatum]|uniref:Uncharacterized protein n=1 Tax=Prorocentrum cordatum TaxID=2364126 RepID=A0ABN9VN00_9DINO|nr:unnamed protein product [Polarella glacialis]
MVSNMDDSWRSRRHRGGPVAGRRGEATRASQAPAAPPLPRWSAAHAAVSAARPAEPASAPPRAVPTAAPAQVLAQPPAPEPTLPAAASAGSASFAWRPPESVVNTWPPAAPRQRGDNQGPQHWQGLDRLDTWVVNIKRWLKRTSLSPEAQVGRVVDELLVGLQEKLTCI